MICEKCGTEVEPQPLTIDEKECGFKPNNPHDDPDVTECYQRLIGFRSAVCLILPRLVESFNVVAAMVSQEIAAEMEREQNQKNEARDLISRNETKQEEMPPSAPGAMQSTLRVGRDGEVKCQRCKAWNPFSKDKIWTCRFCNYLNGR